MMFTVPIYEESWCIWNFTVLIGGESPCIQNCQVDFTVPICGRSWYLENFMVPIRGRS